MYAIFRAQGKQFRADPDAVLRIPSLDVEPGEKVTFDEVLLAENEGAVHVGAPSLDGASVAAEVVRHGRGEKIVVYKMKRRKGHRKKQGHRQGFTEIRIVDISVPKGKPKRPKAPPAPKSEAPVVEAPVEAEPVVEAPETEAVGEAPEAEGAVEAPEPEAEAPAAEEAAAEIDITDAARELAAAHGLDLTKIEGTGKDGRILKSDIDKAIKAQEG